MDQHFELLKELIAERDALREALERINVHVEDWGAEPGYTTSMYMALIQDTARAALAKTEQGK